MDEFEDLTRAVKSSLTEVRGVAFWGDAPELWDSVIIEGRVLPGTCDIRGEGFHQRVQKVKTRGKHGHAARYVGTASVDFEVVVKLWTAAHLDDFAALVELITHAKPPVAKRVKRTISVAGEREAAGAALPRQRDEFTGGSSAELTPGAFTVETVETVYESGGPRTIDIYHPALALFGIRSATVMKISLPEPEAKDVYRATLRCSQLHLGNRNSGTGTKQGSTIGTTTAETTPSGSLVAPVASSLLTGP